MNMKMRKMVDQGFTLIELLVVVLIIGVLSGIVVLAVSNSTATANEKACRADASALLTALDTYAADPNNAKYPVSGLLAANKQGSGPVKDYYKYVGTELDGLVPNYIKSLPETVTAYFKPGAAGELGTVAVGTTGDNCGDTTWYAGVKNA